MAKPKTKLQKEIDKELKKINPNFSLFTEEEYRTNTDALKIQVLFSEFKLADKDNYFEKITEKEKLLHDIAGVEYKHWETLELEQYDETAKILGLINESLIHQIKHIDYFKSYMQVGEYKYESHFVKKLEKWVEFCNMIDTMVEYIKIEIPNWNKMKSKEKKIYIDSWKMIQKAPFMKESTNLRHFIIFLTNFGLHQHKRAKADYLISLGLPNIDNEEVALKVLENTNLFYMSNK